MSERKAADAEFGANLQNLGTQVAEGFGRIHEKIDAAIVPLSGTLKEHAVAHINFNSRLDRIEEERLARANKAKAFKASITAIVTGAIAIGIKELITWLVK